MTSNQLQLRNIKENERHDAAVEQETVRHNTVTEQLERRARELQEQGNIINKEHYERADQIARWNTEVINAHYWRADTISKFQADTQRLQQQENARHNIELEALTRQQNAINAFLATENKRHNQRTEYITQAWNDVRAVTESAIQARERQTVSESQTRQNYLRAQTNTEAERRNLVQEQARTENSVRWRNYSDTVSNYVNSFNNVLNGASQRMKDRVSVMNSLKK